MTRRSSGRSGSRYLAFVSHAFDRATGRFRNFLSYARHWLEPCGSEDSHGRALWALGAVVGRAGDPGRQSLAGDLFHAAIPAVTAFTSPRAWAYALLGIDEYLRAFQGDSTAEADVQELADRLLGLFRGRADPTGHGSRSRVTYCNARLSQALIVSGDRMRSDRHGRGRHALARLADLRAIVSRQTVCGHRIQRILRARRIAGDLRSAAGRGVRDGLCVPRRVPRARRQAVADAGAVGVQLVSRPEPPAALALRSATGGCRDGLHVDRANENQGAEATLSFLLALHELRTMTALDVPGVPARALQSIS